MNKSVVILIHVGFWVCYFILIFIALSIYYRSNHSVELEMNAFKSILLFAFVPSSISYFLYYFILFSERESAGITQQELASKCGTTRNYISRIENNKSDIELRTLRKIIEIGLGKKLELEVK